MLPKSGDILEPGNRRPIAVLDVVYKLFANKLYSHIAPCLGREQSNEQIGFRPHPGIDDALVVLECTTGRAIEFQVPLWIVSVDLTKTFIKIMYNALFHALAKQGLPPQYISLPRNLYRGQTGRIDGAPAFPISRVVRQGDVLSALLFYSALEEGSS